MKTNSPSKASSQPKGKVDDSRFVVNGLGGKRSLSGTIAIAGAKNAALKEMAATVLFAGEVVLENVPEIEDVKRMHDLLAHAGVRIDRKKTGVYNFSTSRRCRTALSDDIAKRFRASIVLAGPILARFGKVSFPHPGGCLLGERPIDIFLNGFRKMGAEVKESRGRYLISTRGGSLKGVTIHMRQQSVTATETFMMAGVLAKGKTVIKNASLEPEIEDLAEFLIAGGAKITGVGTPTITITGAVPLVATAPHSVVPDRIETGSYMILAALAAKEVSITHCNPEHVDLVIELLRDAGVKIDVSEDTITVFGSDAGKPFRSFGVKTHEYPGFPTDLQSPMTVFLTQAQGESLVFETIFEGRFGYVEPLVAMGADIITMDPHRIMVKGPTLLHGKILESPDLRAGLAFVIAAIVAKGTSIIHNIYNIDRGYDHVEKKLRAIGVNIKRIK